MTVTAADLARHLGFATTPADTEVLDRCLATARATIRPHLLPDLVPEPDQEEVLDGATLKVAAVHWRSKDAPGGLYMMGDTTDAGAYLPRDALVSAWPDLVNAGLVSAAVVA